VALLPPARHSHGRADAQQRCGGSATFFVAAPCVVAGLVRLVGGWVAYFSSKISNSGATVSRTVWSATSIRVLSPV
jgi:hypothetical protein